MSKIITTEIFIERSLEKHGTLYDYSKSNYIDSGTKITITCSIHGDFLQTGVRHWTGQGCPECGKIKIIAKNTRTQGQFLEKATFTHGDSYSYAKTDYIYGGEKVIITCKIHGDFEQTPNAHLSGQGCPKCGRIRSTKESTKTQDQFLEKASKVHNNFYDYSKVHYIGDKQRVTIICPIHGDFNQIPNNHEFGQGCPRCGELSKANSQRYNTDIFIEKSNKKHNFLYGYSKTNYISSKEKVTIECPVHGDFKQIPTKHIAGGGCQQCGNESHWKRSDYIKKAKSRICTYYIIRCFNGDEEFYKIGITMNSVRERYRQIEKMPYNYEIISEIYGEAGVIWDMELSEKRKLKDFNYQPNIVFGGSKTECFTQYKNK